MWLDRPITQLIPPPPSFAIDLGTRSAKWSCSADCFVFPSVRSSIRSTTGRLR